MITTVHDPLGREWEMRIANQLLATTGRQGSAVDKGREDRIRLRTAEQKALFRRDSSLDVTQIISCLLFHRHDRFQYKSTFSLD